MAPLFATPPAPRRAALVRRTALAAAALAAGAACNDPVSIDAALDVQSASLVLAALTGTAPNTRSALQLRTAPVAVAPEATSGDFHVVLDINAAGRVVVYPAALVTAVSARRVAIRRIDAAYDSVTRAPTGGYLADSALTVGPGDVVGVQLSGVGGECIYTSRPYFYSKLVVDSVRTADRAIFVRATTDPNCGFRSFAPGRPDD